jgi:pyruvate/2-oxoglutarate dehydrogenase complex dihydrolipoamide dehydrogenase (E3) component
MSSWAVERPASTSLGSWRDGDNPSPWSRGGLIGGSCPNIACLPSKNVIHSAKVVGLVRRASTFGLRLGPWSVDMAGVRRRKRELVNGMIAIHKAQFAANGLEFILGEGRFVGPKTIEVRLTQGGRRCAAPSDP